MSEYEYEVTFFGEQWRATVLCYHEHDFDSGPDIDKRIEGWALLVADQTGLNIQDYREVRIEKTGALLG